MERIIRTTGIALGIVLLLMAVACGSAEEGQTLSGPSGEGSRPATAPQLEEAQGLQAPPISVPTARPSPQGDQEPSGREAPAALNYQVPASQSQETTSLQLNTYTGPTTPPSITAGCDYVQGQ